MFFETGFLCVTMVLLDRLCRPGWPQIKNPPVSASKCWDERHEPPLPSSLVLSLITLGSKCFVCLSVYLSNERGGRVSLYSPGWPETPCVDQADFQFRDQPASAPFMLGLKAWAPMPG